MVLELVIVAAIACQPIGQSGGNPELKPGDEIDGMIITTGGGAVPPLQAFCPAALENENNLTADCDVPPLPRLAIGNPFERADEALQVLDWSEMNWELYVDERPVDLEAFGVRTYVMPDLAPHPSAVREIFRQMKAWDVVLTELRPGRHTLHGTARTGTNTYTWVVNLTINAAPAQ
jgi:hypothetical protein